MDQFVAKLSDPAIGTVAPLVARVLLSRSQLHTDDKLQMPKPSSM